MAYMFVTGIDTDGKVLGAATAHCPHQERRYHGGDAETGNGIFSTALPQEPRYSVTWLPAEMVFILKQVRAPFSSASPAMSRVAE